MFALVGLGTQEIVLLGVLGLMGAVCVVVVLFVVRAAGSSGRTAALEKENRRLREELDGDRGRRQDRAEP